MLNETTKNIYNLSDKFIEFDKNYLFEEKNVENYPDNLIILEPTIDYNCKQLIVKNLYDLLQTIQIYKVIAVEKEYKSMVISALNCTYYEEILFKNSFEGLMWKKIFSLDDEFISNNLFAQLEVFREKKIAIKSAFEYIEYSYLK